MFKTIDDLKRSADIYTDYLQEYINMGKGVDLMADFMFLISILRRAVDLNNSFITLTDSGNFIAAAPLLRLQLDNMLYSYACTIKPNTNDFLVSFMNGGNWKDIEDIDGNKLSDDYLLDLIYKKFDTDEFKRIYKESSEYIHLSTSHLYLTTLKTDDKSQFLLPNFSHDDFIDNIKHVMLAINYGLLFILSTDWIKLRQDEIDWQKWLKEQNPTKLKDELIQENSLEDKGFRNLTLSQLREKK